MRLLGIILIAAGIFMTLFNGINFQTKKKIVDAGPIEISKKEDRRIGWPVYAGGVAVVAGILVLAMGGRKREAAGL